MIDIHDELRQLTAKLDEQNKESKMPKVDMSADAVTTRLKRVSQLRRLGLSLQKAKIRRAEDRPQRTEQRGEAQPEPRRQVSK